MGKTDSISVLCSSPLANLHFSPSLLPAFEVRPQTVVNLGDRGPANPKRDVKNGELICSVVFQKDFVT